MFKLHCTSVQVKWIPVCWIVHCNRKWKRKHSTKHLHLLTFQTSYTLALPYLWYNENVDFFYSNLLSSGAYCMETESTVDSSIDQNCKEKICLYVFTWKLCIFVTISFVKGFKVSSNKGPYLFYFFFLIAECVDHFYGDSCSSPCGNCLNGRACDKHNGACSNGCKAHFKGPTCDGKNIGNRGCIICLIVMFVVSHPEVLAIMDYH